MALPELLMNSPVPGTAAPLAALSATLATGAKSLTASSAPPSPFQVAGQFRVVIDSEIILVAGGSSTTTWTILERAAEGSVEAAHATGAKIFHDLTLGALRNLVEPPWVVTAKTVPLGAVSGNVTPNLAVGRVFKMTSGTGALAIQRPINLPAGANEARLIIEIEVVGKEEITTPFINEWLGGKPPWNKASSTSINLFTAYTDNGGTTWNAVGGSAGNITKKEVEELIAEKGGLSKATIEVLVDEAIAHLAAPAGGTPYTITGSIGVNLFQLGQGSGLAEWASFPTQVEQNATAKQRVGAEYTGNAAIPQNKLARAMKEGIVLTLPLTGPLVAVANNSPGGVTVKGKFTVGTPGAETTPEIASGRTVIWLLNEEGVWTAWGSHDRAPTLPAAATVTATPILGEPGRMRGEIANIVGDGTTTKFTIKHALNTRATHAFLQTEVSGKPHEQIDLVTVEAKWVATSETEGELTFKTGPAHGTNYYVKILGWG